MISKYKHGQVTWVDMENPTQEEVNKIANEYNLNPLVANDLLTPSSRPTIEEHTGYLYLILHFPIMLRNSGQGKISEVQEIDFILGKDYIITNRYSIFDSVLEFSKTFSISLANIDSKNYASYVFFKIILGIYEEMNNRLANIGDLLNDIESQIFESKEKEMVFELSKLNRLLLNFNKSITLQEDVIKGLISSGEKVYGQEYQVHFKSIFSEHQKIKVTILSHREYLSELRNTNDSLLSAKQNEIIQFLTILAFITFPLSVITQIFGMNAIHTPIVGSDFDFWIILGIILITSILITLIFRFKKWL